MRWRRQTLTSRSGLPPAGDWDIRLIPAVYKTQRLPESVTTIEQAQEHASQTARQWNRLVCLVWSRRLSVYFDEQGQVEVRAVATPDRHVAPFMRIGNKRFLLGDADHATPAKG